MKSILLLTTMSFLFFLAKAQSSQDKEAVNNVVIAFQKDFNDGFKGAALYTTTDWEHIPPGGGLYKGRDSILKDAREIHQSYLKGVTIKIESIDINFPVPDVVCCFKSLLFDLFFSIKKFLDIIYDKLLRTVNGCFIPKKIIVDSFPYRLVGHQPIHSL